MSFSGYGMQGGLNACYPFYERLITCVRREALPVKMCTLEGEDYMECIQKKKQVFLVVTVI